MVAAGEMARNVKEKAERKMMARVKELTSRSKVNDYDEWKKSLKQFIVGWVNYYKLADMKSLLKSTDEWMRRRIRMVFWKKWKRVRTRYRNLRKLGTTHANAMRLANSRKGYRRISESPIIRSPLQHKAGKGRIRKSWWLLRVCNGINKKGAVYRTVRTVLWEVG